MTVFRPSGRIRLTLRTEEFSETEELEARLPSPFLDSPDAPPVSARPPQTPGARTEEDVRAQIDANQRRLEELERRRDSLPADQYEQQRDDIRAEREQIQRTALDNLRRDADFRARQLPSELQERDVIDDLGRVPGFDTLPIPDFRATTPPESVSGASPDDRTVIGDIEPLSVQIERNGLATAGTATVVIDFEDAPFDSRVLRAAHVEAVIGVVPAADHEAGIEQGERREDGSLLSLVGAPADGALLGATRFVGFVDSWGVKYSDEGNTITLECRDMSAPMRDMKLNPGESIDLALPIDEGIRGFLNSISASVRGVNVVWRGEGDPIVPSAAMSGRRGARRGRRRRRQRRGDEDMSLWDHITDATRQLGLLVIMRDYDLIITEARTLFSTVGVRRMVYGRNLSLLEYDRRLQGVKVPTIEVRCLDQDLGRVRWGRYPVRRGERSSGIFGRRNPPRPLRANEVPPSGSNPEEAVTTIVVSGVTDGALLERIARNYFEQVGRQEIEGALETYDVSSYDVDPELVDILRLQPGEPLEILVASGDPQGGEDELLPNTTLSRIQSFTIDQRRDYFEALGWSNDVANRFATLQEASGFQTVFRTQDVRIAWDTEEGVKVNVGFVNYVTVREDEDEEDTDS